MERDGNMIFHLTCTVVWRTRHPRYLVDCCTSVIIC